MADIDPDIMGAVDAVLALPAVLALVPLAHNRVILRGLFVREARDPHCSRCKLTRSACRSGGCPMTVKGGAMTVTVESIHPRIIVGVVDRHRPWRADVIGDAPRGMEDEWEREAEDIDALPVEEQAAIACSILAEDADLSCFGWPDITGLGFDACFETPVFTLASRAIRSVSPAKFQKLRALRWAEAESRIRSGEVRR